jgi:tetratricopeptide (TPR) repeat protein
LGSSSRCLSPGCRRGPECWTIQKAITYGEKALEIAEKSKDPNSLFRAIHTLILTYNQVRNFDKARELIEKGFAVAKGLPPNTDPRAYWEGVLYMHLGSDLVRRREYEKAIDVLSLSVYLQQSYLLLLEKSCRVKCA